MATDFSQYKNRCALSEQFMRLTTTELGLIFIRLQTFMEIGNHPDRQGFWEYLEKIIAEKQHLQLVINQEPTRTKNQPTLITSMADLTSDKP